MKKVIALCVALCLVFALGAFNAMAADSAELVMTADKTEVKPGDVIKLTFSIAGIENLTGLDSNYRLAGFQFDFNYDPDFFEIAMSDPNPVTGERTPLYEHHVDELGLGTEFGPPEAKEMGSTEPFIRILSDDAKLVGMIDNGDLLSIFLKVKDDVEEGAKSTLSFKEIGDICDYKTVKVTDQFELGADIEFVVAAEDPSSEDPSSEDPSSEDPSSEDPSSEDPSSEDPISEDPSSTDPKTPSTGEGSMIAIGALMIAAAGAAFVTMKKSKK